METIGIVLVCLFVISIAVLGRWGGRTGRIYLAIVSVLLIVAMWGLIVAG